MEVGTYNSNEVYNVGTPVIHTFNHPVFGELRGCMIGDKAWFVAKDVCECLGLGNSRQAITRLDDDEKGVIISDTLGGRQNMTTISESGFYKLVFTSTKAEAKRFQKWVTSEVLPQISRKGAYNAPTIKDLVGNPDLLIEIAQDLKEKQEQIRQLEHKVEKDKPKVVFADAVSTSESSILVGELSKLLRQNGIDIGQNRLFDYLRDNGYVMSCIGTDKNMPTQRSMNLGIMEIKETAVSSSDGFSRAYKTTKITGKGQIYFINKFLKEKANGNER